MRANMNKKFKRQIRMESKFKIGDVVANTKHKTVGVVTDVFDRGDVRTDADGVVSERDIVPYDKVKHANYQIAPSTRAKMKTENVQRRKLSLLSLYERNGSMFNKEYEYTKEERDAFMEAVRNYAVYGDVIRRSSDLKEAIDEISELVDLASNITLKETDGWFDNVTTSRHGKQMKEAVKVLQKEAQEIIQRQQRLEAAYEDIGQLLGRYYDV